MESATPKASSVQGGSASNGAAEASEAVAKDYTVTNNQVEGVDEADIIKTDGKYVYVLPRSGDSVVISEVFPTASARIMSRVNLTQYNLRARDAMLDGNTLVLLGHSYVRNAQGSLRLRMAAVHLWDITNRSEPVLRTGYEVEGSYLTARVSEGFAYALIITRPVYHYGPNRRQESVSKHASGGSESEARLRGHAPLARQLTRQQADLTQRISSPVAPVCACEEVTYVENLGVARSWVTVVAVATVGEAQWKTVTHAGRGESVVMSTRNLYVAGANWDYSESVRPQDGQFTAVLEFALGKGNPSFTRLLTVPGTIVNQFAMDEYQGHFRIATTFGGLLVCFSMLPCSHGFF